MRSVTDRGSATGGEVAAHRVDRRAGKVSTDDRIVVQRLDPASSGRVAHVFALAMVDEPVFTSVLDCAPRLDDRGGRGVRSGAYDDGCQDLGDATEAIVKLAQAPSG